MTLHSCFSEYSLTFFSHGSVEMSRLCSQTTEQHTSSTRQCGVQVFDYDKHGSLMRSDLVKLVTTDEEGNPLDEDQKEYWSGLLAKFLDTGLASAASFKLVARKCSNCGGRV